jgi:glycosyltransferase involved in cell wall biosynthesis
MPFLSIVIPAHNEESRLPGTLRQVIQFIEKQSYSAEILVVENGSRDRTFDVAQEFAACCPNLRVIRHSQRGKGYAVQTGMLEAAGEYRFMCDADLSMPIEQVNRFLPPILPGAKIAIGSREAPGSVRYNEPSYRHIGGRGINLAIRLLALPGLQDSQCGFKCFHQSVVKELFSRQTLGGWSFDIEVLFIARRKKYPIVEVPIDWYFNADSKLDAFRDALRMMRDVLHIRRNALQGLYDRPL